MTTDVVVDMTKATGSVTVARAVKPSAGLDDRRTLEKLEIEHRYWAKKGIDWGIVTEGELPVVPVKNLEELVGHRELQQGLTPEIVGMIDREHLSWREATEPKIVKSRAQDACHSLTSAVPAPALARLIGRRSHAPLSVEKEAEALLEAHGLAGQRTRRDPAPHRAYRLTIPPARMGSRPDINPFGPQISHGRVNDGPRPCRPIRPLGCEHVIRSAGKADLAGRLGGFGTDYRSFVHP